MASTVWLMATVGLPPLVRGAPLSQCVEQKPVRPTPAGAGSTSSPAATCSSRTAYPRWCGEHSSKPHERNTPIGLPPLVRGAPDSDLRHRRRPGPTPAGAGSTTTPARRPAAPRAYPRWCGEHLRLLDPAAALMGLPPLVRGAQQAIRRHSAAAGPTPAGAGSTARLAVPRRGPQAYPRWCGEHVVEVDLGAGAVGLPPLVRGARPAHGIIGHRRRPTPAGAGSTRATRAA